MALITALELAKTYLIFDGIEQTEVNTRVENALVPASFQFEQDYKKYQKNKYIPDEFNSISVENLGNDKIKVKLDKKIIRKLYYGYELEVETGNYDDTYTVLSIDTTSNTITLDAVYYDESIVFFNKEKQIYEGAKAWYICSFTRFTLQEVKACTYMASSSQLGNGSATNYSVISLDKFRKDMLENAKVILRSKNFPTPQR